MAKLDIQEMEEKWEKYWAEKGIFKTKDLDPKKTFSIDTPPPNISGKMHIGHAFSYSQQDFIVRFMRMYGKDIFYPFGTDDNGLPTERLVEKSKKVKSTKMSRAEFIKMCLDFLKDYTPDAVEDWKRLGVSCDFEKTYSTINPQVQKVSQKSFVDLYKKGHIVKKSFPTIWCPECQTSIAQAELEDKELPSKFSTLKFNVEAKDFFIATTRPELLYACVAVFVNPKDKRYSELVGKKAKVPLFDFEVPIIADESAEIDKGTGALMICSYGDKYDVEAIQRHRLTPKTVITKDGKVSIPGFEGLKIKEARKKILEDLKEKDLIEEQKEITHVVNVHDKCGTEIEFVDTPQWFIKILDKKKELLEQGDKIKWYPEFMKKRYEAWVNGLEWDWSISRNRHFGVPIPVWECESCKEVILPNENELPIDPIETKKTCPKCGKVATPETMVLDTWATSSLTPQIASDLFDGKVKIPFSLRPNGHDIIRTWAFYTIAKAYLHEDKIPWKEIIISGMVSFKGEKMSKSKGNVIDPNEKIEKYGADALRFWAAGSKLGQDQDYQEKELVTGKKVVNKLINSARFVFMNLENYDGKSRPENLERLDDLFLKKLNSLIKEVTKDFLDYNYAQAKKKITEFFLENFSANYMEIVKKRVYQGTGNEKLSAEYTLYRALLTIVKLFAPIMPYVTEEIYQENFKKFEKTDSVHLTKWPESVNEENIKDSALVNIFDILTKVRQIKTSNKKSMTSEIILTLDKGSLAVFEGLIEDLKNVTGAQVVKEGLEFGVEFL